MKKLLFPALVGTVIFGVFWLYGMYTSALHYALDKNSESRVIVEIEKGSTADDVAEILYQKKLIKSRTVFKLYLKQNNLSESLKAGKLVVFSNQTLPQIVEALVSGKSEEMAVTILEGWTAAQIGEHLESLTLTTKTDFLNCLKTCEFGFDFLPTNTREGYLYPDTYFVNFSDYSDEDFIKRLIGTFEKRLTTEDLLAIEKSGRTLNEVVIMASIVEREERDPLERPKVAGILWKRLDEKIGLGADATMLYGLGRTKGGLTQKDLETDSLYNTRKYRDLPPTPISNPDIQSLRATIYPEDTPYYYYLHDNEGEVHYGKTLDEHNQNKAKYIR